MIDATCPLVTKVHVEAVKFAKQGYSLVLIGHRDHDEIEGTLGEAPDVTQVVSSAAEVATLQVPDPDRVAYLTQTTLSLDEARDIIQALKEKFPNIVGPHSQDICYATENRQVAVKNVAHAADLVLVVGSTNSSNSNRLVEVSRNLEHGRASDRQLRCHPAVMARRRLDRRGYRGCVGSGDSGLGSGCVFAEQGLWDGR